jgi:hypothetical protein
MYPHERSLVQRLDGKPFAILGINSDSGRKGLKEVLEKEHITWRSWWDGGSTEGPIATRWNVKGWPTIYVLDDRGVIRYKDVQGNALDKAVDALLKATKDHVPQAVEGCEQLLMETRYPASLFSASCPALDSSK